MNLRHSITAAVSAVGLSILMHFEGYATTAYQDGAGVWTICYGHTKGVTRGQTATKAQCDAHFKDDLKWAQVVVDKHVTVPISVNQFDALVLLVFNIGETNFRTSTLLRKLNAKDYRGAAVEFPKWNNIRIAQTDPKTKLTTSRLVPSNGLTRRRLSEMELFLKED